MNYVLSVRRGITFLIALLLLVITSALIDLPGWVTGFLAGMVIGVTAGIAYVLARAIFADVRDNRDCTRIINEPHIRRAGDNSSRPAARAASTARAETYTQPR